MILRAATPPVAVPAWSTIPSVSYRLTDDEARAAIRQTDSGQSSIRFIWGLNAAIQLFNGISNIGRTDAVGRALGMSGFIMASLFGSVIATQLWSGRPQWPSRGERDFALSFDEFGIHRIQPQPALIPWKSIDRVQDLDDVLLFRRPSQQGIVVPKRVFADNGQALWAILVDRLIAKGSLQRRADSRTIANTALR